MPIVEWSQFLFQITFALDDLRIYLDANHTTLSRKASKFFANEFLPIVVDAIASVTEDTSKKDIYWLGRRLLFQGYQMYFLAVEARLDAVVTSLLELKTLQFIGACNALVTIAGLPPRLEIGQPPPPPSPP